MKSRDNQPKTPARKAAVYSLAIIALVVAVVIMANVFMAVLPVSVTQIDTTSTQILDLSDMTKKVVAGVDEDVTIYWIAQSSQENPSVKHLVEKYASMNPHLTVDKKDPDTSPSFIQHYTSELINNNSLIVESDSSFKYIDYYEIFEPVYTEDGTSYTLQFNGENALTSAIAFVTNKNTPTLYFTTGHGEKDIPDSFLKGLAGSNITTAPLSILTAAAIPDDADCLLINAPATDFSPDEISIIRNYISTGGNVFLATGLSQEDTSLKNIYSLGDPYELENTEGLLIEPDSAHYGLGIPYNILPELSSHAITDPLISKGYQVMLPISQGLKITGRSQAYVTRLLTTSKESFSKDEGYSIETYEKDDGDISGPFSVGVAVEDGKGKLIWITSAYLIDEKADSIVSGGNRDLFLNAVNWMCSQESNISIHAKDLGSEMLSMDSATASFLSILVIAIIPAAIIVIGCVIWIRRKNK